MPGYVQAPGNPHVNGHCPACKNAALFLDSRGDIFCGWGPCGDPLVVGRILRGEVVLKGRMVDSLASRIWNVMTDGERAEVVKRRSSDGPGS